jgi:hypothetical protein
VKAWVTMVMVAGKQIKTKCRIGISDPEPGGKLARRFRSLSSCSSEHVGVGSEMILHLKSEILWDNNRHDCAKLLTRV